MVIESTVSNQRQISESPYTHRCPDHDAVQPKNSLKIHFQSWKYIPVASSHLSSYFKCFHYTINSYFLVILFIQNEVRPNLSDTL